ncbi:unnamed protein product [Blepharisma stoltei]|uniref:TRP C-terminal domain-containing protein n=1 Tax=Blepharisma stoltei TaxID=1481888 RepID=A0AAU9IXF0_9CILI|nr:unnamed protein product [Blepharisma stoltei]
MIYAYALNVEDTETAESMGDVVKFAIPSLFLVLIILSIFTFNRGGTLYSVWYFMTWYQFIRWIPLINSDVPEVYDKFFQRLAEAANDHQFITYGTSKSVDNKRLEIVKIKSTLFINNAEEQIVYWLVCALAVIIIGVIGVSQSKTPWGILKRKMKYNCIIRATLVLYFDFLLFAILQLEYFDTSGWYESLNSVIAIVVVFVSVLIFFILPVIIKIKTENSIENENSIKEIDTLITEFSAERVYAKYNYWALFFIVRIVTASMFIILSSWSSIQALVIGICVFVNILFIFFWFPFKTTVENIISGLAEICTLLLIIQTGLFNLNGWTSSSMNYMAWGCISVVYIGIVLCLIRYFSILALSKHAVFDERSIDKKNDETVDRSSDIKAPTKIEPEFQIEDLEEQEVIQSTLPFANKSVFTPPTINSEHVINTNAPIIMENINQKVYEEPTEEQKLENKEIFNEKNIENRNRRYGEGLSFYPRLEDKYKRISLK